jgi:outer membrane protein assembly factor BamB
VGEAPAYRDGIVHSIGNGNYRAINAKTGGVVWSLEFDPYFSGSYSPMVVISDHTAVIFKQSPKQVMAIDTSTHQVLWTANIIHYYGGIAWHAVADSTVYAVNGYLEVFDLANGNPLWSFAGDERLSFNPVVTQKYVIVSSSANTYVLDRVSHQLVWQTNYGGWLTVANGFLYISSTNYMTTTLYAYRAQEP